MKNIGSSTVDHESAASLLATPSSCEGANDLSSGDIHAADLADRDSPPLPGLNGDWSGLIKLVNIRKLRDQLGLTQEEFAKTYWIPLGTLRDWEQRRKLADRTAQAYLKVIEADPQAVAQMLKR